MRNPSLKIISLTLEDIINITNVIIILIIFGAKNFADYKPAPRVAKWKTGAGLLHPSSFRPLTRASNLCAASRFFRNSLPAQWYGPSSMGVAVASVQAVTPSGLVSTRKAVTGV